ncbi:alpha-amylase family glycosyl hydrolase [Bacillus alkalicellulosilyticus]|uniref:alpha-amylase family glycosyl hydrolase n=1 Tax=Alkalihalobacterium alkalicellulosilyticum TaxID=1912214 RepID=UPI000996C85A|nr:alpha-amylase family glycosyl hydrolase [Bacillus alkalicellulosilyticus]
MYSKKKWYSLALALLMLFSVFSPAFVVAQNQTSTASPVVSEDGTVVFTYENDSADRVRVAGGFTSWQENALEMTKRDGIWSKSITLTPDVYQYKFIVGENDWIVDPLNSEQVSGNSKLVVPGLKLDSIPSSLQTGTSRQLTAELVNQNGDIVSASDVAWSLVDAPSGVSIDGTTLRISESVPGNATFKVKATKDNYETTRTITTVGVMYEYTINFHRSSGDFENWDMWIYNSGYADAGYAFSSVSGGDYTFAKGTHSFPENDITLIPRKKDWSAQAEEFTVRIPNGQTSTEVWLVQGITEVFTSEAAALHAIRVREGSVQPHIRFTYDRPDANYEDWDVWVWGTGAQDNNHDFTRFDDGKAIAEINIGSLAERVGFIVRKTGWTEREPGGDRFITINKSDPITKVYVTSGETAFFTVPAVKKPEINDGNATFQFRDPQLYLTDEMSKIEKVELSLTPKNSEMVTISSVVGRYEMTNEPQNERFVYTYNNLPPGEYEYSFFVTIDGVTTEVSDPYHSVDGTSVISYFNLAIDVTGEVAPAEVDYNQNAVLSLDIVNEEEAEIREIYVDLSEVGGPEKVTIDPEIQEITIAVDHNTTAGVKTLPITVVDVYGNDHYGEAEVTVKARHSIGDADFDWDEARIYFLLTDRFFDGDSSNNDPYGIGYNEEDAGAYKGGDFKGITAKLDYLHDLGVNTIWINPIVENILYDVRHNDSPHITPYYGYHGYWASNFEELNPHFGTMEDFHELIDEAHERGMKLMIDVVLNHTGYGLKEADARLDGTIPHFPTNEDRERFAGMLRDGGSDTVRGELAGLPDFITEDPEVREQIVQWQVDWIEKSRTPNGNTIDYFRVDTVKHVEDATWMAFKNEQTKVMPEFKMIGESWGAYYQDDHGYLNSGMMDSLLDFEFKNYAINFANGQIDSVEHTLQARNQSISNGATLGQFLGSHDEIGFLDQSRINGDEGKLKLGAALQITSKGQPVIYYGEELGYSGEANYPHYTNRYVIDWDEVEDNDIHEHYTKLLNARAEYSQVFSKGTRTRLAGSDAEGFTVFEREFEGESVVVAINVTESDNEATFAVPFTAGSEITDIYGNHTYTVNQDQTVTVTIPNRDAGGTVILAAGIVPDPVDGELPTEPGTEQPGVEQPGAEEPGIEQPGAEQPVTEQPGTSKPGVEQPKEKGKDKEVRTDKKVKTDKEKKGDKLPSTATNMYNMLVIGTLLVLVGGGIVFYVRKRKMNIE